MKASAVSPEQCVCVYVCVCVCVCVRARAHSGFKWYNEIVTSLIYSGSIRSCVHVGVHVHSSCTASAVMVR